MMTDTDIIIAVAKLDELSVRQNENKQYAWFNGSRRISNWNDWEVPCPRLYLTSRDAIIPVIEKCITDDDIQIKFNYALYEQLPKKVSEKYAYTFVVVVIATPKQLCIALLKATGKWKD